MHTRLHLPLILSLAALLSACSPALFKADAPCERATGCFSLKPDATDTAQITTTAQAAIRAVNGKPVSVGQNGYQTAEGAMAKLADFPYSRLELPAGIWRITLNAYRIEEREGRVLLHDFSNTEKVEVAVAAGKHYRLHAVSVLGHDQTQGSWAPVLAERIDAQHERITSTPLPDLLGMNLTQAQTYFEALSSGRLSRPELMQLRTRLLNEDATAK